MTMSGKRSSGMEGSRTNQQKELQKCAEKWNVNVYFGTKTILKSLHTVFIINIFHLIGKQFASKNVLGPQ